MQLDRELSAFNNPLVKLVKIPVDPSNASISLLIGEIEVSIGTGGGGIEIPPPPFVSPDIRNIQKLTVNTILGTR